VDEAEAQVRVTGKARFKRGETRRNWCSTGRIARLDAQRQGDINEQTATVARLQAQVQNAAVENQRYVSVSREPFLLQSVIANPTLATAQKSYKRHRQCCGASKRRVHRNWKQKQTSLGLQCVGRDVEALRQKLIGRS